MTQTKQLLAERGKVHGDHITTHTVAMSLFRTLEAHSKLKESSDAELFLVCVKLARGVQVPNHKDHWDDIQGYVELIKSAEVTHE